MLLHSGFADFETFFADFETLIPKMVRFKIICSGVQIAL